MAVRDRLEALMAEKRVSQSELARRLGREPGWINQRLPEGDGDGKRTKKRLNIAADDIPLFAKALGVNCFDFFQDSDCPEEVRPFAATSNHPTKASPYADIAAEGMLSDLPQELRELVKASVRVARLYGTEPPRREQAS